MRCEMSSFEIVAQKHLGFRGSSDENPMALNIVRIDRRMTSLVDLRLHRSVSTRAGEKEWRAFQLKESNQNEDREQTFESQIHHLKVVVEKRVSGQLEMGQDVMGENLI
jgi:hypothetical protein